jgi:hypothetical protein
MPQSLLAIGIVAHHPCFQPALVHPGPLHLIC